MTPGSHEVLIMNCYDEGRLRAYLDGELPPLESAALGAHLAACLDCQAQLSRQRALAGRVRSLLPIPPAGPEPRAALARLRAATDQQRSNVQTFKRSNVQRSTFMQ